jgi:hypothetical protein
MCQVVVSPRVRLRGCPCLLALPPCKIFILCAFCLIGIPLLNIEKPRKKSKENPVNICAEDNRSILVQGKKICYLDNNRNFL